MVINNFCRFINRWSRRPFVCLGFNLRKMTLRRIKTYLKITSFISVTTLLVIELNTNTVARKESGRNFYSDTGLFRRLYSKGSVLLDYAQELYSSHGNIVKTSINSSVNYIGKDNRNDHNERNDVIIPGKYAWIPYPVKRNPSGPFILKTNTGSIIKYTNYTFYPLTINSSYIINNPNICNDVTNLTFLIMVHTALPHFYQRQALRETWANPRVLKRHSSRILFLVGRKENETVQRSLETESKQFQDIVQGDFIDDYHNLTHKGVLGYRWITEYCQNAKFILKIDDDVFVNIFRVIHTLLPKFKDGERKIACRFHRHVHMYRRGKFAVDPDYFPGLNHFPLPYCPGPFVLMPRSIVPEMFEVAKTTPFHWVDDFYIFGILPNEIRNVVFLPLGGVHNREETALKCYLGDKPCNYLAAYAWTPGVMYTYWNSTLNMHKKLVEKYAVKIH